MKKKTTNGQIQLITVRNFIRHEWVNLITSTTNTAVILKTQKIVVALTHRITWILNTT